VTVALATICTFTGPGAHPSTGVTLLVFMGFLFCLFQVQAGLEPTILLLSFLRAGVTHVETTPGKDTALSGKQWPDDPLLLTLRRTSPQSHTCGQASAAAPTHSTCLTVAAASSLHGTHSRATK
jgi:hypothetical protein